MKRTYTLTVTLLALSAVTPAFCAAPPTPSQRLSQLSTEMLHHVDLAREAISNKETHSAEQHVTQALTDQSRIASLAKAHNLPGIIPLYAEFDTGAVLGPLEAARKSGQKPSPNHPATPSRGRFAPITVDETTAEYTYVGLDLDKAKQRLDAAQTALHDNNLQAADDSLSSLQNDLVMQTVKTDTPLLTARENLGIAEDAVKNNHYTQAAAALKEAASDLNRFASGNPPHHAEEAKTLAASIQSFADKLSQNQAGAPAKIDAWWNQVNGWFTRPSQS